VAVGDVVEEFQQLCEVASDKAAVEITSRYAGTVERLHHQPGDMVQVEAHGLACTLRFWDMHVLQYNSATILATLGAARLARCQRC
jgi:hypothetical protein